jgi:hypothetical protein
MLLHTKNKQNISVVDNFSLDRFRVTRGSGIRCQFKQLNMFVHVNNGSENVLSFHTNMKVSIHIITFNCNNTQKPEFLNNSLTNNQTDHIMGRTTNHYGTLH